MPSLQCLYHLAPSPCAVTSVTLRCTPLPVTSTRAWRASSGVTTSTAREGGWTSSERACPSWPSISFAPVCSEPRSDLQCWQIFIIWSCNGLLYNEYDQSHFALRKHFKFRYSPYRLVRFQTLLLHCCMLLQIYTSGGHAFAFASLQDRVGFTKYVQIVVGETMRNNEKQLSKITLGYSGLLYSRHYLCKLRIFRDPKKQKYGCCQGVNPLPLCQSRRNSDLSSLEDVQSRLWTSILRVFCLWQTQCLHFGKLSRHFCEATVQDRSTPLNSLAGS